MQGILTLLFLIGLMIAWAAQLKKRAEQEEIERKKRIEKIKKSRAQRKLKDKSFINNREPEDLVNRHLKTNLKNTKLELKSRANTHPVDRTERLSLMKRAIVWSEILGKPVIEREL